MKFSALKRYGPPVIIYGLIFYFSAQPASTFPDIVPDIVPHFSEYFLLSYFFFRMFERPINIKTILVSLAILLALAFLDELHQFFVPSRHFELKDLLVDTAGIVAGMFVYKAPGGPAGGQTLEKV